ncbi:MAG: serine hydrolase domain-containing protein [Pirellulales bacterium]
MLCQLLIIVAAAVNCDVIQAEVTGDPDRLVSQVDAMFAKYDRPDVPGCAVGIIQDGKLIYSKGFGSANLDYEVAIRPHTSFDVASVTKSFTSVCLALLMDQGKLRPEDDIRKYLVEMHAFEPPITVGDLLRCHSGLRDYIHLMQLAGWPLEPGWVEYTEPDVLQILAAQRTLQFPTGTKLGYSNSDYFLLGQIVERVSGKPLSQFAKENVFEPLGMSHTGYLDRPAYVHRQRAVGYVVDRGGRNSWFSTGSVMGACGVHSTVEDLFRWDQNFYDNRLPRGDWIDEFMRNGELAGNRFCLDTDANTKKMKPEAALGPAGHFRGLKRMQFTGGGWGSLAGMARYPDQRFTVICLANNEEIIPWMVAEDIAALYLANILAPQTKHDPSTDSETATDFSEDELRQSVGSYIDTIGRIWKVSFRDSALYLTHDRFGTFRLNPIVGRRFLPVDFPIDNETVRFELRSAKPRASLIYDWGFGSLEFKPFDPPNLTDEQLKSYVGDYYSDEMMATYRFRVADGSLQLRVNNHAWEELTPTLIDQFVPARRHALDSRIFKFGRDIDRSVSGLEIDDGRALGVRLQRTTRKQL